MRKHFNFLANTPDPYGNDMPLQMGPDGKIGKYAVPSAAEGSPNLSRDASGGFIALLHPNEAVIPLPDGRSVPVKLPEDRARGRGGNVFNVNVTINAKDAASFRQSEDQVMQTLQRALDRATMTLGKTPAIEDPTKRAE